MNLVREIREEFKSIWREPSSRDLTILALLFLLIPSIIGGWLLWKGSQAGWIWIIGGAILAATRLISPLFRKIHYVWVGFSAVLGYFVSRIILTLLFVLIVIPTGLLMRLFGKDPMDRKLDPETRSYWIKKEPEEDQSIERYEKQY